MPIQVEYLLIVKKADAFCESVEAFNQLLNVDSRLHVTTRKIKYDNQTEYDYNVQVGEISNKAQRFFLLTFSLNESPNEKNVEEFAEMLRAVRLVIRRVSNELETLWDDISGYYAELSYQKIHCVENLMRKLITNFMLVNVGADWVGESAPEFIKELIEKSKRKDWTSNVLHAIDFIHLSDYLLSPYSEKPIEQILEELEDISEIKKLDELREQYTPRSNWTRYFSEIVDCEEEYLKKRWEQLYELRCKVAHNAIISKDDFQQISTLSDELSKKLTFAIEKIREVKVPEEEVNQIVTEADATVNASTSPLYRELQRQGVFNPSIMRQMKLVRDAMPSAEIMRQMKLVQNAMPNVEFMRQIKLVQDAMPGAEIMRQMKLVQDADAMKPNLHMPKPTGEEIQDGGTEDLSKENPENKEAESGEGGEEES